jgi:hypothetical protein
MGLAVGQHHPVQPAAGLAGELITVPELALERAGVPGEQPPGRLAVRSAVPAAGEIVQRTAEHAGPGEQEVIGPGVTAHAGGCAMHGRDQRQDCREIRRGECVAELARLPVHERVDRHRVRFTDPV